jgi:2,3-bisphosphoglycerate-dependent phosphoglycerate mutase
VRHGESIPARADVPFELVGGHGDPPLDPRGMTQAERVAARLARPWQGEHITALYVTNLQRTSETAAPLAARLGLEPMVEADLREVLLGEWEGGLYRIRILEGDPLATRVLEEERWDLIPGAEAEADFTDRVKAGIDRIAAKHPDETVAVFTHGGVIGRVLSLAAGSRPFAFTAAGNASISQIVVSGGRWLIRCYNDTAHLDRAEDLTESGR